VRSYPVLVLAVLLCALPARGNPGSAVVAVPGRSNPGSAVVLCYHHFEEPAKNQYTITPATFEAQLKWLKDNQFHVIPMRQLVDAYHGKGTCPEHSVVISIDDGWSCANKNALPLLKKYGFPCTLFIYPDMIGKGPHKSTYDDYKEIAKDPGVSLACHSWSHPNLLKETKTIKGEELEEFLQKEYVRSKQTLSEKLGMPIRWLAFPHGLYDADVARTVQAAGYEAAFTINGAPNNPKSDPMFLNRFMIMKDDSMKAFIRKVSQLSLQTEDLTPRDGATVPPGTRTFAATVTDPDVDLKTVALNMAGRTGSKVDVSTGRVTIHLVQDLQPKVYQISVQGKDKTTGHARRMSWQIRVKVGATASASARPAAAKAPVTPDDADFQEQ
jgi:peptidoglycan/xylan/chitin deacetylase (PgdA/CDA1 family)